MSQAVGIETAWLVDYFNACARLRNVSVEVQFYQDDQFQDLHDWWDIKLTNAADPAHSSEDKQLHVGALVEGLGEDAKLDKLPIILYRTIVNDPQDTPGYLLSVLAIGGYYSESTLGEPCAEANMQFKVAGYLENPEARGNGRFYKKTFDLDQYSVLGPATGDDGVKEFAFFDNSPTPKNGETETYPLNGDPNGVDCFFMAEILKGLGWISRGVAHPTDAALACDDDDDPSPDSVRPWAKGSRVWGRPVANDEFVWAWRFLNTT